MKDEEKTSSNIEDVDLSMFSGCIIDSLLIQEMFWNRCEKTSVLERCIDGGTNQISFFGSSIMNEQEYVVVQLNYKIRFPVFQTVFPSVDVLQKVQMRSFNGFAVPSQLADDEEQKSEVVYMTEHGTVYHTNRNCTYLVVSCEKISSSLLEVARNKNGEKYHACKHCFSPNELLPSYVYVTKSGDCYHKNMNCSSIKRNVIEVPIEDIGNCRECKKCQALRNQ